MNVEFGSRNFEFGMTSHHVVRCGMLCRNSEFQTRRRLLRRIRPHLKEEAMSRPQVTVRRVGRGPTATPNSELERLANGPH